MNNGHIIPDDLEKLVVKHFGFIIDELGFILGKESDWAFDIESSDVRIYILFEHSMFLTVALEPIGEKAKELLRCNIIPKRIEVVSISMCIDPELIYKVEKTGTELNIINLEMAKRANLLNKNCLHMLKGDFSEWNKISDFLQKRAYELPNIWN